MAAKIVLTREPSSTKFTDRVLLLSSEPVPVSRSSKEEKPDTTNAVFACKVSAFKLKTSSCNTYSQVLSKSHAFFSFSGGHFYLKDTGSSNGSFINNFRLSKPGQSSLDSQLFSQDVVRFGSEVSDKNKMVKEKCIVGKIRIYLPSGEECGERPANNR